MEKIVYFVRHGQAEANVANTMQGLDDPLTQKGVEQAESLASRFKHVAFDVIVASDAMRAKHTAETIGRKTDHTVEISPLFREYRRPTSLIGMVRTTPQAVAFYKELEVHADDSAWHFEDEENFFDARARAIEALAYIENRSEERLVVVTHGNFKRYLLGAMLFGEELTYKQWQRLVCFQTSNTGVTMARLEDGEWKILTWNDYAHLAE